MLAVGLSAALLSTTAAMAAWAGDYLTAQLVVGDPAALTVGDTALKNVMEGEGYTVQLVDDNAAVTATPAATDLVVIGPSTSGTTLGSKYGQLAVPEVILASTAWDSMGLTEDDGVFYDSTSLNWVDTTTPIAAWLPNPVQLVPTNQSMRSMVVANLADGATPVAVRSTNTAQNVIFTFSPGDNLTTGTAPAPRVVAGLSDPALANLTANGTQLIVNLVTWAAEGSAPLLNPSIVTGVPQTGCPRAGAVACYEMNETTPNMVDSSTNPVSVDNATGAHGVKKVPRNNVPAEYFFPGWKGKTTGTRLTADVQLKSDFGQVIVDRSGVTAGETFNPGTGAWRITTRLKPFLIKPSATSPAQLPDAADCSGCPQLKPSYNVIQKGRNAAMPSQTAGGFYKVEIMGYDASNFVKGSVHCQFKDTNGASVDVYSGKSIGTSVKVTESRYYVIDCFRAANSGSLTLKVTREQGQNRTTETITASGTLGSVAPDNNCPTSGATQYSCKFAIGKKVDSPDTNDAFSGWIDYVVLDNM